MSHSMGNYTLFPQYPLFVMYNMFSEAFVPPATPPSSFPELPANIIACICMVTLLFMILNHILNVLVAWLLDIFPELDLEGGDIIYGPHDYIGSHPFRQAMHRLGVINRVIPNMDEERGPRLRATHKLPPLVNYGSHEIDQSGLITSTGCAICLEDFAQGESCQVFSICNHIFHSDCIDHWLMNKPTCPVCRNCIVEASDACN